MTDDASSRGPAGMKPPMLSAWGILRKALRVAGGEWELLLILFAWLLFVGLTLPRLVPASAGTGEIAFTRADFSVFLIYAVDIYLSVCIYAAVRNTTAARPWRDTFFRHGWYYLSRVLLYYLLAFTGILFCAIVPAAVNEMLASQPLLIAAPIVSLVIAWMALPLYLVFLTAATPYLILLDDAGIVAAARKSTRLVRRRLSQFVPLALCLGLPWAIANFHERFYTIPASWSLAATAGKSLVLSFLTIVSVKAFLLFCLTHGKEPHEGDV